jgi:hypothetical protein
LSNDPKFAEKLKDIVGLYVDPPARRRSGLMVSILIGNFCLR